MVKNEAWFSLSLSSRTALKMACSPWFHTCLQMGPFSTRNFKNEHNRLESGWRTLRNFRTPSQQPWLRARHLSLNEWVCSFPGRGRKGPFDSLLCNTWLQNCVQLLFFKKRNKRPIWIFILAGQKPNSGAELPGLPRRLRPETRPSEDMLMLKASIFWM